MTSPNYPVGPGQTVVAANGIDVTVDRFRKDPIIIQRTIAQSMVNQTIAQYLFRTATSGSGMALYSEATLAALYVTADGRGPGRVEAGGEFPWVGVDEDSLKVAVASKYGGEFGVTDEMARHDNRDLVGRGVTRVTNTLIRDSNTRSVNAFYANTNVRKVNAASPWTQSSTSAVPDITKAISLVDNDDFGYSARIALIHPDAADILENNDRVAALLPRERPELNPLLSRGLAGLKDLQWIRTRRVPRTDVIITDSLNVGAVVTELPITVTLTREDRRDRTVVTVRHMDVPVITDPLAAVVLQGVIT